MLTTPQKEREIKLVLSPTELPRLQKLALLRAAGPAEDFSQVSVYFDTDKQKLRTHRLTLRVRRIGDRRIQTIKASQNNGILSRDEWETEIAGDQPDLDLGSDTALAPLLTDKLRRQLRPLFQTQVRRSVYSLIHDGCTIALSIDRGRIDAGKRSAPLCEVELELTHGTEAALFDLARQITRAVPAQIGLKSKSERGYGLVDGTAAGPAKFSGVVLSADMPAREAFSRIGFACLEQILDNEPALLDGDPEGVHQMRVGLRRFRAAISLFAAILRDGETAAIKRDLKWLTGELTPAREFEVLMARVVAPAKKRRLSARHGLPALSRQFAKRRADALTRARIAVTSERFRLLGLDIAAWLEIGEWTQQHDDLMRDRGDLAIEVLAAEQLQRRRRKVRTKRKVFAELSARRRHKLRIQTKKLRYASEFFAGLYPGKQAGKRRKRFLIALKEVQAAFGDLNDIVVHEKIIGAAGSNRRQCDPAGAFAAGLLTGREDARLAPVMAAATKAYAAFARCKPFWR